MNDPIRELAGPDGSIDIRSLFTRIEYPVLAVDGSDFRLSEIRPIYESFNNPPQGGIYQVDLVFGATDGRGQQKVLITNTRMRRPWFRPAEIEATISSLLFSNNQFVPAHFEMPFNVAFAEFTYKFAKTIRWKKRVLAGLEFQLFQWNRPGYFSLAYHALDDGVLFVEAAGMSHPEFLGVLNRMVVLQGASRLIDKFQGELRGKE